MSSDDRRSQAPMTGRRIPRSAPERHASTRPAHTADRRPVPGERPGSAGVVEREPHRPSPQTTSRRDLGTGRRVADPFEALGRRPRQRADAAQTISAVLLAFLVAAQLGSGSLVGLAERQRFGTTRDIALSVAEANDRVANFLSLNRPRDLALVALGRESTTYDIDAIIADGAENADGADPQTTPTSGATVDTADGGATADPTPTEGDEDPEPGASPTTTVAPTTTEAPTTTTQPSLRAVTPAEPLDLFIAGDSMMQELGNGLLRLLPADLVDAELDYRVSTGLSRPDFFDWPQRLAEVVTQRQPDATVVFFGTNDNQNLSVDGAILQRGSAEWEAEYRSRVATVMDLLAQPGTTVTWVGLPIMRDQTLEQGVLVMNRVYAEEAAKRPNVTFVDTHTLFADANGQFAEHLPGADGSSAQMRQGDGIHLSIAGADRMAAAAWAALAGAWGLS